MRFNAIAFPLLFVLVTALLVGCGGEDPTGPSGPPVVTSVNSATLPSGPTGSTVILEGRNFGSTRGDGEVLFSNGSGGTVAAGIANPEDWTDVFIVTTVPAGAATGDLVVRHALGTSDPVTFTVTQNAAFSPSTVSWTSTNPLPVGLSGHAAAFAVLEGATTTRVVYAIGGADATNTPQATTYYATVGATGALSAWAETSPLPVAVAFHRVVVASPTNSPVSGPGYLYVLGGATDATGLPSTAIYRGAPAAGGTVSAWTQAGSLPAPLHSFGAAIVFGHLYVWGGATTDNAPVATVYRAAIQESGGLGSWETLAALPSARAYFGSGAFAGHLYVFGGTSNAVSPHDGSLAGGGRMAEVLVAKIDFRSRDLDAAGWTLNPSTLIKAVNKHTAAMAGGNVLITAGLYNGAATGSTEESFAQLNGDGSAGSFQGATGSNTIASLGGGNLFNHATVGYVDGDGIFHVLVVGGDDVNAPGTKRTAVYFY